MCSLCPNASENLLVMAGAESAISIVGEYKGIKISTPAFRLLKMKAKSILSLWLEILIVVISCHHEHIIIILGCLRTEFLDLEQQCKVSQMLMSVASAY